MAGMSREEAEREAARTGGTVKATIGGYIVIPGAQMERYEEMTGRPPTTVDGVVPTGRTTKPTDYVSSAERYGITPTPTRQPTQQPTGLEGFLATGGEVQGAYTPLFGGAAAYPPGLGDVGGFEDWTAGLEGMGQPQEFPTEPPPPGYYWEFDPATGGYFPSPQQPTVYGEPGAEVMTQQQLSQLSLERGRDTEATRQFNEMMAFREREMAQAGVPGEMSEYQQWQSQWYPRQFQQEAQLQREQMAQQQQQFQTQQQMQQQNYLSQLAANPQSWLEYSAAAGQQPAVQPWMLPLMPQEYSQLGAGAAIPGFGGTQGMTGMPGLTTPSAQYAARMGPTAQQQYLGYQQAQTGARPEETMWRQGMQAPPGGGFGGLRRTR